MNKSFLYYSIVSQGIRAAFLGCLYFLANTVQAQTAASNYLSLYPTFTTGSYDNPAVHYHFLPQSYAQIQADYSYQKSPQSICVQEGKGERKVEVSADAFRQLTSNTRIWGQVDYQNTRTYEVQGCENLDYHLVYPYVLSDSLGGDLLSETYRFNAGYARQINAFTLGITLGYRAISAYRDYDPRPRNKVGHLRASIGVTYPLNAKYLLGIMVGGERYKQSQTLKYYDPLKFQRLFHNQGLGVEYTRFAGNRPNNNIQGNRYHFEFSLYPQTLTGWGAALGYHLSCFEKMLTGYNDVPINNIQENLYTAYLYYQRGNKTTRWAIKATAKHKKRNGDQNIFGSEATHTYEKISSRSNYKHRYQNYQIAALYEHHLTTKTLFSIMPSLIYTKDKQQHLTYSREIRVNTWQAQLQVTLSRFFKSSMFHCKFTVTHRDAIDSYLSLTQLHRNNYWYAQLLHNYIQQKGAHTTMQCHLRYDTPYQIAQKKIYIFGSYRFGKHPQALHTHWGNAGLGIQL
jgi:hypothetical protein